MYLDHQTILATLLTVKLKVGTVQYLRIDTSGFHVPHMYQISESQTIQFQHTFQ